MNILYFIVAAAMATSCYKTRYELGKVSAKPAIVENDDYPAKYDGAWAGIGGRPAEVNRHCNGGNVSIIETRSYMKNLEH